MEIERRAISVESEALLALAVQIIVFSTVKRLLVPSRRSDHVGEVNTAARLELWTLPECERRSRSA
jgi:hypothetical protein